MLNLNIYKRITNVFNFTLLILILGQLISCGTNEKEIISNWELNHELKGGLDIIYPANKTLFPSEIIAPTFIWNDSVNKVQRWFISVDSKENKNILNVLTKNTQWRPNSVQWKLMKSHSIEKEIQISIVGLKGSEFLSGTSVSIITSKDSVNAPIFYRDVPLPFKDAIKNLHKIKYRLGDISVDKESKVLLTNLAVCGNCHSFTKDGQTMAMDVDYANDKGSYVISDIEEETTLSLDKIISWSEYKRDEKEPTFGLLSQISPDGRYVASTVKDRSIFVAIDKDTSYSQLFFPIKGIISIYDRKTEKFFSLPGADNTDYCQSNPTWSPDGKSLIFTRAKVYKSKKIDQYKTAIIPTEAADEFINGGKEYKYDLYIVPFNNGKGGKSYPIAGASQNGKSNFFPKISPDGKWLIFTQAENFMLLQPDSKLVILPFDKKGEARILNCNNSEMNSWHSWSPNSKWVVFSSKEGGAYTQLYLSHIDDEGNDTPPVLIENFNLPKRAINIPEFVNRKNDSWDEMVDVFSDSSNYPMRVGNLELYFGKFEDAIESFTKAINKNPDDYNMYYTRALAYMRMGKSLEMISDISKSLELKPDFVEGHVALADIFVNMKNYKGAIESYDTALKLNFNDAHIHAGKGIANAMLKDYSASINNFNHAIKIEPDSAKHWTNRAISKKYLEDINGAIKDLKKAEKLNPNYFPTFQHLGDLYFQTNQLNDAEKVYSQAIKIKSNDHTLYHKIGDTYFRLNQYQKAINAYNQSISIKPGNIDVYLSRGVCNIQIKKYQSALSDFDKCVEINPEDYLVYFNRGDVKHKLNDLNGASENFSTAISLKPDFRKAYYERGIVYLKLKLIDNACKDLHKSFNLGYTPAKEMIDKNCK